MPARRPAAERLAEKLIPLDHCLIWMGATVNGKRYGVISDDNGRQTTAHRVAWSLVNGPVPGGLELDHVKARGCLSGLCCNVEHLEPVTHPENLKRAGQLAYDPSEVLRSYLETGSIYLTAAALGMSKSTVHRVVARGVM